MTERVFELNGAEPAQLYGPSNTFLKQIGAHFPTLKIVARGHAIKVLGPDDIMDEFEDKLEAILAYVSANKALDQRAFDHLIQAQDAAKVNHTLLKDEIILHGPNGRIIKA
ncbi:MAG: hypothetical protein ACPHGZ_05050, partial [Schleiferiaceae bacterium]